MTASSKMTEIGRIPPLREGSILYLADETFTSPGLVVWDGERHHVVAGLPKDWPGTKSTKPKREKTWVRAPKTITPRRSKA